LWDYRLKCGGLYEELKELKEELDKLANPGSNVVCGRFSEIDNPKKEDYINVFQIFK